MAEMWTFKEIIDGHHGSKMVANIKKWLPVIDVGVWLKFCIVDYDHGWEGTKTFNYVLRFLPLKILNRGKG